MVYVGMHVCTVYVCVYVYAGTLSVRDQGQRSVLSVSLYHFHLIAFHYQKIQYFKMHSLRISYHLITVLCLFILFVHICAYMNRVQMCMLGTCGTEKIGSPELEVHVATGSLT